MFVVYYLTSQFKLNFSSLLLLYILDDPCNMTLSPLIFKKQLWHHLKFHQYILYRTENGKHPKCRSAAVAPLLWIREEVVVSMVTYMSQWGWELGDSHGVNDRGNASNPVFSRHLASNGIFFLKDSLLYGLSFCKRDKLALCSTKELGTWKLMGN